jgi:hypothetical protein
VALGLACAAAGDMGVGASIEEVHAALGRPNGYIKVGAHEMLVYDRGRVELRDGLVTDFHLVSEEEARARKLERKRRRSERLAAERERREQLRVDGKALKQEKQSDPLFAALSARERLAFWRTFRKRYPDVDVDAEYAAALAERERELEQELLQRRVDALEQRVAAAEQRARRAEPEAAWAGSTSRRVYVNYTAPVIYCPPRRKPPARPVCTLTPTCLPHVIVPTSLARPPYMWQSDYFRVGHTAQAHRPGGAAFRNW